MPATQEITFDKLGVTFTESSYWVTESQPVQLARLLAHFLNPDVGEGWILVPETGWVEVTDHNWQEVTRYLEKMVEVWTLGQNGQEGYEKHLTENGRCAIFMDAERFVSRLSKWELHHEGLEQFYVGFEVDWSFLQSIDISCLTPHARVTNYWPALERWAPIRPEAESPTPLPPVEAANLLEDGLWRSILTAFRGIREAKGPSADPIDVGFGDQEPPVFYFASPVSVPEDGASYLEGNHLKALNCLGRRLLASTDMRSTEIPGGVMEGCLAVFSHCPDPRAEYFLMLPLAGAVEPQIESKIHFLADKIHFIDLDATQDVKDIVTDLELGRTFSPIWKGSAELGVKLIELLYSLLPKAEIQERMFSLTHLLDGFLTKLQTRSQESSMTWDSLRKRLAGSMEASRDMAQRFFTVQPITGVRGLEIAEGRTRTNQRCAHELKSLVEEARSLPGIFKQINLSLNHTATLEEQKREREKKRILESEEAAAKRLNLVLAAVAGLAAIPLLFGQYDVQTLVATIGGWFPFDLGPHVSFLAGLATLLGITFVLAVNYLRRDGSIDLPSGPLVAEVSDLSDSLFDSYRSYQHWAVRKAIFQGVGSTAFLQENTWDEGEEEERTAREMVHGVDLKLAETAALALDRSYAWDRDEALPRDDDSWAEDMERKVCRFVLLGDVIDLRPEDLHLPLSLSVYRFMYEKAGLSRPPVSDAEYRRVMLRFGYSDAEVAWVDSWVSDSELQKGTAVDFVKACLKEEVTALHKKRLVEEEEATI